MKFALVAMNVRFLFIICNFEIFSTVNSSMASKMAVELKILFIGNFCCSFYINLYIFAIRRFRLAFTS